jgi:hypothetical protein
MQARLLCQAETVGMRSKGDFAKEVRKQEHTGTCTGTCCDRGPWGVRGRSDKTRAQTGACADIRTLPHRAKEFVGEVNKTRTDRDLRGHRL